jgi:hypothetical protein
LLAGWPTPHWLRVAPSLKARALPLHGIRLAVPD